MNFDKDNLKKIPKVEIPKVSSEDILGVNKELIIVHGDEEYHLRLTKNGRLLLTK